MPDTNNNQQSPEHTGSPTQSEQSKAGLKPVGETGQEEERLANEYTEDGLDAIPPDLARHPNRNLDKPKLDKPPYS